MNVIDQMRVVVAVAEHGSLTAAAQSLGKSLPTVVRVLASTEVRLGSSLFDRTTRKVHITDEGLLYVDACRRILDEIAEVEDALRDRQSEPKGLLTVTAPVFFGRIHVAPVLSEYLARHPNVSARLALLDRVVDLSEEGIDVAVRIGHVKPQGLVATKVGKVRRCLCISPALAGSLPPIDEPDGLAHVPFIQLLGLMPTPDLRFPQERGQGAVAITNVRLTTNDAEAAIAACVAGLGVGNFLSYQVHELVQSGRLLRVLSAYDVEDLPVSLVYLPTRRLAARTRSFIQWAKDSLARRLSISLQAGTGARVEDV
jgi:DNA-binding transcriptional LysR family regulator